MTIDNLMKLCVYANGAFGLAGLGFLFFGKGAQKDIAPKFFIAQFVILVFSVLMVYYLKLKF